MAKILLVVLALCISVLAGLAIKQQLPDVQRYLHIRSM
jgi:uncharacterized protein HemY